MDRRRRPRIENYLAAAPDAERGSLLAALLGLEVELRRRAGEPLDAASFLARFPEDAGVVESALGETPGRGTGDTSRDDTAT